MDHGQYTRADDWQGRQLSSRYLVTSKLGQGGMAVVYHARDERLHGREVVIKVPLPALLVGEGFAERFAREVRALLSLTHAHIVDVLDEGEQDGIPFVVLKHLAGGNLRHRIEGQSPLQRLQDLRNWLPGIAQALDFIHARGLLHRDVKPDNILFDGNGHAYLGDFGIAKALSAEASLMEQNAYHTMAGEALGTPQYMAPELILGANCDGRTDQYALAVTVYEVLSGRVPYTGTNLTAIYEQQKWPPTPLETLVPAVPPVVAKAVQNALSMTEGDRYATCMSFADAVLRPLELTTSVLPATPQPTILQAAVALCPSCGTSTEIKAGAIGSVVTCSGCRKTFEAVQFKRASEGRTPIESIRSSPAPHTIGQTATVCCPACHAALSVASGSLGSLVTCTSCQKKFEAVLSRSASDHRTPEHGNHLPAVAQTLVQSADVGTRAGDNTSKLASQRKADLGIGRLLAVVVVVVGAAIVASFTGVPSGKDSSQTSSTTIESQSAKKTAADEPIDVKKESPVPTVPPAIIKSDANVIEDATEAIRIDSKNVGAYINRGEAWAKKQEYEKAIADFDEAIRLDPKNAMAIAKRGAVRVSLHEWQNAMSDFNEAIRLDPNNASVFSNRGYTWVHLHDYVKAIADCDQAILLDPRYSSAFANRGLARMNQRDYDQAISDYTEAIRLDPLNAVAFARRGFTWSNKQEFEKAIADCDQAIFLNPNLSAAFYFRGLVRANRSDTDNAIADYTEAIRLDPKNALAYLNRGVALAIKQEYEAAISDYTEAIRLDPKNSGPYNRRAWVWMAKHDYDKAITDYDEAIRLKPNHVDAIYNRGLAWASKRQQDKAIADYTEAIRLDPKYSLAFLNRGVARANKQQNDAAIADFTEAHRLDPNNSGPFNRRGLVWMSKRDYDKAIADFDEAIRLKPTHADALLSRGESWAQKQQYDMAIVDFDETIRLNPKNAGAFVHRGEALVKQQKYDKAIADFAEAIRLDPKNVEAYDAIARVEATCPDPKYRDGKKAVASATKACELTSWKLANRIDTLASAYAEAGDFEEAIKRETQAYDMVSGEEKVRYKSHLDLYKSHKQLRQ